MISGIDRELAFVHACFHAALGDFPPRLVPLRDVVELHGAGFEVSAVMEVIRSARCESVLQRAVHLVDVELGIRLEGELPGSDARAYRPTRFDRWALRGYAERSLLRDAGCRSALRAANGPRPRRLRCGAGLSAARLRTCSRA